MKKTLLYKNTTTQKIFTFSEMKSEHEIANDCEMEIDDATMDSIIYENLACVGGNIEIIDNNDEVLKWCNDYAEEIEADRTMYQDEIEASIRDIYEAIKNNDKMLIEATKDNLFNGGELLERLEKILKDIK